MTRCLTYPWKVLGVAALWLSCVPGFGQVTGLVFDLVETHEEGDQAMRPTASMPSLNTQATSFLLWGETQRPRSF